MLMEKAATVLSPRAKSGLERSGGGLGQADGTSGDIRGKGKMADGGSIPPPAK